MNATPPSLVTFVVLVLVGLGVRNAISTAEPSAEWAWRSVVVVPASPEPYWHHLVSDNEEVWSGRPEGTPFAIWVAQQNAPSN